MTLEQIIKESLDEWSESVAVPLDFPSKALRRWRRQRTRGGLVALASVAAVTLAIAIPTAVTHAGGSAPRAGSPRPGLTAAHGPQPANEGTPVPAHPPRRPSAQVSPAQPPSTPWIPLQLTHAHTGNTTISAHVTESPPTHLIAADDLAVSAYNFQSGHGGTYTYTWYLYNVTAGTYVRSPWSMLDVSPGLGLAAVLEGPQATNRIGLVDMTSGGVIRWIPTSKSIGTVSFSPDGTKLVATTYTGNPANADGVVTGFIVVDLTDGYQTVVSLPVGVQREPYLGLHWTYDGAHLYIMDPYTGDPWFFAPDGRAVAAPAHAEELTYNHGYGANVSPNGTMADTDGGSGDSPQTTVKDINTGHIIYNQPVEDLQGWANNTALIAWGCDASCHNENHSRLVLVSVNGKSVIPLTGFVHGKSDTSPGQWRILLTRR